MLIDINSGSIYYYWCKALLVRGKPRPEDGWTMTKQDARRVHHWVLDDLATAQQELVGDLVQAIQRVRAARAALAAAAAAGMAPEAVCFTDTGGQPFTVEQLRTLVSSLEAELETAGMDALGEAPPAGGRPKDPAG